MENQPKTQVVMTPFKAFVGLIGLVLVLCATATVVALFIKLIQFILSKSF